MFKYFKLKKIIKNNNIYSLHSFLEANKMGDFFVKKLQNYVLDSNNAEFCYQFASEVKGADVNKLQEKFLSIIKTKNITHTEVSLLYMFAKDVKNINPAEINNLVLKYFSSKKLNKKDAEFLLDYCLNVKNVDVLKFEDLFLKCKHYTPKLYVDFAQEVKNCDLNKLQNKLILITKYLNSNLEKWDEYLPIMSKQDNVDSWNEEKTQNYINFKYLINPQNTKKLDEQFFDPKTLQPYIYNYYFKQPNVNKNNMLNDFINLIKNRDEIIKNDASILPLEKQGDRLENILNLFHLVKDAKNIDEQVVIDAVLDFKINGKSSPFVCYLFAKDTNIKNKTKLLNVTKNATSEQIELENKILHESKLEYYKYEPLTIDATNPENLFKDYLPTFNEMNYYISAQKNSSKNIDITKNEQDYNF